MRSFYDTRSKGAYFEGWYLKHQNEDSTLALIPAFHQNEQGKASASLQIITPRESFFVPYPIDAFRAAKNAFGVRLGENLFTEKGCTLAVNTPEVSLRGSLCYSPFEPLAYSIMGPFAHLPFMECKHSVFSMEHRVIGTVFLNGQALAFHGGKGYMEGDRGHAFPRRYLWTQCSFSQGSLMLSVAEIPYLGMKFTGCIGVIRFLGQEYRVATYSGVKLLHITERDILLTQGALFLRVTLLQDRARPLRAPGNGRMERVIRESAACKVRYRCTLRGTVLFDFISNEASFESEWMPRDLS